jgi:type IV pilus assembly protein PilA
MTYPMGLDRRRNAARALSREDGFSLIELLVVLIIIGILAAIAIAIFSGQQSKAHDVEAKTAARTAQIAMETYYIQNSSYSGATVAELEQVQPALRDAPDLTVLQATSNQYEIASVSTSATPVTFTVTRSANGTIARACTPPDAGGCKAGAW